MGIIKCFKEGNLLMLVVCIKLLRHYSAPESKGLQFKIMENRTFPNRSGDGCGSVLRVSHLRF